MRPTRFQECWATPARVLLIRPRRLADLTKVHDLVALPEEETLAAAPGRRGTNPGILLVIAGTGAPRVPMWEARHDRRER